MARSNRFMRTRIATAILVSSGVVREQPDQRIVVGQRLLVLAAPGVKRRSVRIGLGVRGIELDRAVEVGQGEFVTAESERTIPRPQKARECVGSSRIASL